jgi:hypothetical protein
MMKAYLAGNMPEACKIVDEYAASREGTGDELMWRLEQGKIKFDAGFYDESLKAFERAEQIIEDFDSRAEISARDAGAETGAAFTNQNALPYKGFIYDRILLNAYKALVYFALGKKSDAMVEIRRMHERQKKAVEYFDSEMKNSEEELKKGRGELAEQNSNASGDFDSIIASNPQLNSSYNEILEKAGKTYGNFINPFSLYLSAVSYLMDSNYNDANVDFRNLYKAEPLNKMIAQDFSTSLRGLGGILPSELESQEPWPHPLNKNIVFVIFENGITAAFKEEKAQIILPPPIPTGYSGIAFPVIEKFHPPYDDMTIESEGKKYKASDVADMDSIVAGELKEIFPYIITRLVISTIIKEAASYAAQMAAEQAGGELAKWGTVAATSIYKYTFNTADTRCWQTLPQKYMIAHFPKPQDGTFSVTAAGGLMSHTEKIKLSKDANFAIVHIRAQSEHYFSVKLFEF